MLILISFKWKELLKDQSTEKFLKCFLKKTIYRKMCWAIIFYYLSSSSLRAQFKGTNSRKVAELNIALIYITVSLQKYLWHLNMDLDGCNLQNFVVFKNVERCLMPQGHFHQLWLYHFTEGRLTLKFILPFPGRCQSEEAEQKYLQIFCGTT